MSLDIGLNQNPKMTEYFNTCIHGVLVFVGCLEIGKKYFVSNNSTIIHIKTQ